MFTHDREDIMEGLARIGATLCCYCGGPNRWAKFCDCKYGGPDQERPGGEQTGCPEVRSAYRILEAITDDEWDTIRKRAGMIITSQDIFTTVYEAEEEVA